MTPLVVAGRRSSSVSPVMMLLLRWRRQRGEDGLQIRRIRVGGNQVGKRAGHRLGRLVDAVTDPRSVEAADQQGVERVDDVVLGRPAAAGGVRAAREHGALDLEVAAVGERLGRVDDEEVRQQQLGQGVDALIVERPVGLAVQPVEEGQIGAQPGAVGSDVVLAQVEGVLRVVEVADLEIAVDGIELRAPHDDVLDLRSAHALQPDRVTVGGHGLADDGHQRAGVAAEHRGDVEFEDDGQHVHAVQGVGGPGLERQLLLRLGGQHACQVDEERIEPRTGEDPHTARLGRLLLADPERDLRPARRGARAGLHHGAGAVARGRNGEAEVEGVLVSAGHEGRCAAGRRGRHRPETEAVVERVGEQGRGCGSREYVQDEHQMTGLFRAGEGVHVGDVGRGVSKGPRAGEVVCHDEPPDLRCRDRRASAAPGGRA
ncbi:hypothetical protein SHIRM173S_06248 [Streptomyces hirsutus]